MVYKSLNGFAPQYACNFIMEQGFSAGQVAGVVFMLGVGWVGREDLFLSFRCRLGMGARVCLLARSLEEFQVDWSLGTFLLQIGCIVQLYIFIVSSFNCF